MQEKLEIVQQALKHFNLPYSAKMEGDEIVIDVFTITKIPSGYSLYGAWEIPSGMRDEPAEIHETDFIENRSFFAVIERLLILLVQDEFRCWAETFNIKLTALSTPE